MKILLIALNAKYIHSNLAVHDLQAYATAHGSLCDTVIEIAEYTINQTEDDILTDIYRRRADVVLFSCYIWNMNLVRNLVSSFHRICPQVPIWLGGPEVSFHPEEILREMTEVKGIFCGEGERSFTRFAEVCSCRRREPHEIIPENTETDLLMQIPGIVFRVSGEEPEPGLEIRYTIPAEPVCMDDIPFFYADKQINPTAAVAGGAGFANRILYYESSRGCPFRCSYCLSSLGEKVRFRSLALVFRELQFFLDANVPQVKFVDRTFNCRHSHAVGIWRYLREHDNGITNFHFEIAADLLTPEEIDLLGTLRPGQVQLEIGVQSTNPKTLQGIERVQDMDHLRQVVDAINAGKNIHQHLDLIVGLPYEDLESFRKSFDAVYSMRPDQLQLGFLKVLKGSAMERCKEEYGIQYQDHAPYEVLSTKWIDYADIIRLKGIEEMTEVYCNSHQFPKTMEHLIEHGEGAFAVLDRLAAFYREHDLHRQSHSRMERFRILRVFAKEFDAAHAEVYDELLTYDLYLRENSKTRPDFASAQDGEKEIFRRYFRDRYGEKYDRRMHHGERFFRNLDGWSGTGPWYVEFDYGNRDPLSGNAAVYVRSVEG